MRWWWWWWCEWYIMADGGCYRTLLWRRLSVATVTVTSRGHPKACCVCRRERWGKCLSRRSTISNNSLATCSMNPCWKVTQSHSINELFV